MTDLAEELRMEMRGDRHADLARRAADEIERLQTMLVQAALEVNETTDEIERLRGELANREEQVARLKRDRMWTP